MKLMKTQSTLTLCAALFFWGCPADDEPGGGMNTSVNTSAEATAQFNQVIDQLCRYTLKCNPSLPSKGLTQEGCEEFYSRTLIRSDISIAIEMIDEGRVTFNQAGLQCGLDAYALATNSCEALQVNDCPSLFLGNVAAGQSCLIDEECAMGLECSNDSLACDSGVCQMAEPACASDADCVEEYGVENATCAPRPSSPSGVGCEVPDAAEGEPCNILDCQAGLVCVEDPESLDSTCRAPQTVAQGQPCNVSNGLFCADELRCTLDLMSETRFSCKAAAQLGEACGAALDSLSFSNCAQGLHCSGLDLEAGMLEGVCATSPAEGQPCAEGRSSAGAQVDGEGYCPLGLECINGSCIRRKGYRSPCSTGVECFSGVCQEGTCGVEMCSDLEP